jgi:hypothetical protein
MPNDYYTPKKTPEEALEARLAREVAEARRNYDHCKEKAGTLIIGGSENGDLSRKRFASIADEMARRSATETLRAYRDATRRYGRALQAFYRFKNETSHTGRPRSQCI